MSRNRKSVRDMSQKDLYTIPVALVGIVLSVFLWYVSMKFSVDGFQIASESDRWIGIGFGFTVTFLQILFNRGAPNRTLYIAGILAYVYGILTTFVGIVALRNNTFDLSWASEDLAGFTVQLTIVVCIALAVEILPEHLFIYLLRNGDSDGDFVSSLIQGWQKFTNDTGNHSSKTKSNKSNKNNRGEGSRGGNRPNNVHISQHQEQQHDSRVAQPPQQHQQHQQHQQQGQGRRGRRNE